VSIHADEAIVLSATPYANTSLIVGFLARRGGKVKLVAKGVRAAKSRLGVSLEPATHVHLEWSQRAGADLGTLRKCESLTVFRRLWEDFEAMQMAGRLLKTVDRLLGVGEGEEEHFALLRAALSAAGAGGSPGSVEGVFLVMLLQRLGLAPALRYCRECTKRVGREAALLDVAAGELRCARCPQTAAYGVRLRAGSIATIGEALKLAPESLHTVRILPTLQGEVVRAAEAFLAYHTGAARPPRPRRSALPR